MVVNAGALQVGDVVTWERQTITEIHRQTLESCDCTRLLADGRVYRSVINTTNALIEVVGGPTLAAANQHTNLQRTPVGQPIYRVERATV